MFTDPFNAFLLGVGVGWASIAVGLLVDRLLIWPTWRRRH